jgi:NAD(P)-dependent dehydrogenase (short-subunit alcohol dehydrogenase family)
MVCPLRLGGQPARPLAAHQCPAAAAAAKPAPADRERLQRRRLPRRRPVRPDQAGWAAASYGISKAALNALTSTLAAELADTPVLVNAVCPGLTATWPGAEAMGARPVAEGAASVLWAAMLADDGPSGDLRRDGQPLPW